MLNKEVQTSSERYLSTLDLYFNPYERGAYNYTTDFADFYRNPRKVWGGMTQRVTEGYTDFDVKNIEFVEFIFRPFTEHTSGDAGPDAKLYIDMGSISEDLIPNGKINTEDALETDQISRAALDILKMSRLPEGLRNQTINIDPDTKRTEDLGIGASDNRWTVELWGTNITDTEYVQVGFDAPLQGLFPDPGNPLNTFNAFLGAPRMYGVTFRVRY